MNAHLLPLLGAGAAALLLSACDRGANQDAVAPTASSAPASQVAASATGPIIAPSAPGAPTDALRSSGATLAAQGGNGVTACTACHGAQGEGNAAGGFPRLAGQSYAYLLNQLNAYADERRKNPVMQPIAKAMSDEQRQATAAHYASLAPGAAGASAPTAAGPAKRGRQLAEVGDEARLVQACANCHGPDGAGGGPGLPYLAGQHAGYLGAALTAWRDGSRNTDPSGQMPTVAKSLNDQDLQAAAAFYAQLPPPATPRDRDNPVAFAGTGASAVVSGPTPGSGQAPQGQGTEQGTPVLGSQGPGGGGGGTGTGATGSNGSAPPASGPR